MGAGTGVVVDGPGVVVGVGGVGEGEVGGVGAGVVVGVGVGVVQHAGSDMQ